MLSCRGKTDTKFATDTVPLLKDMRKSTHWRINTPLNTTNRLLCEGLKLTYKSLYGCFLYALKLRISALHYDCENWDYVENVLWKLRRPSSRCVLHFAGFCVSWNMTYVQAVPIRLIYLLLNYHSCYGGCQSQAFNIMNKRALNISKKW